jgi:hypothetical protein
MRLADFPIIQEIVAEYRQLRENGHCREDATKTLLQQYQNEIGSGTEDDGILFQIGLADAQLACRELTEKAAAQGIAALERLQSSNWKIALSDINKRRAHYASAPMPEKRTIKPKPMIRCPWEIGDTFAYRLQGPYAEQYEIAGKYFLFRMVDAGEDDRGRYPIVTVSFWEQEPFPQNAQEFQAAPLLKVQNGGRGFSRKDHFEYRTMILSKSNRELDSFPFRYVGNFRDVRLPGDEIIFENPWFSILSRLSGFDRDCALIWRMHKYCTQGVLLPFEWK